MKCACRQLLQCYTKSAMQLMFQSCSSKGRVLRPAVQTEAVVACRRHELSSLVHPPASPPPFPAPPASGARRRSPGIRVCARFLAVVGVDASVANTSHPVVALRVRQTAHSMKIGSADTAFVVRKQRRAWRVVRLRYAERIRCARHRAAGSITESCVSH